MVRSVARLALIGIAIVAGCAHNPPKTQAKRHQLEIDAAEARAQMLDKNPALHSLLGQSAGYIVFPEVKSGGFIVGGAGAKGVIYERGQPAGYADLSQAQVGALIGGEKYAEMVIVKDKYTFDKMKAGDLDVGGHASAIILQAGAAGETSFDERGVAVVLDPLGGAMLNASITGQRIKSTM